MGWRSAGNAYPAPRLAGRCTARPVRDTRLQSPMQKPAHKQIHSHAADAPPLQTAVCWRQWLRRHACLYGALALVCVRVRARRSSRAIARVAPACLNVLVLCTISAVYGCDGPEQDVALKDQGLVVQEIEQRPVLHQLHDELRTRMTGHTRTNVSGRATVGWSDDGGGSVADGTTRDDALTRTRKPPIFIYIRARVCVFVCVCLFVCLSKALGSIGMLPYIIFWHSRPRRCWRTNRRSVTDGGLLYFSLCTCTSRCATTSATTVTHSKDYQHYNHAIDPSSDMGRHRYPAPVAPALDGRQ